MNVSMLHYSYTKHTPNNKYGTLMTRSILPDKSSVTSISVSESRKYSLCKLSRFILLADFTAFFFLTVNYCQPLLGHECHVTLCSYSRNVLWWVKTLF